MQYPPKTPIEEPEWIFVQTGLFHYPLLGDEKPGLLASRCKGCGEHFFPKRLLCPKCFGKGEMEDVTLDRRGIIYASTVVHISPPIGLKAPYAYGYVEIPANGIRVFALFTGDDPHSFTHGGEVELVLEPLEIEGRKPKIIGYMFKPVS
jgi:uncharacterized OB-fold protein